MALIAVGAGLIVAGIVSKKQGDDRAEVKVPEPPIIAPKKKPCYLSYDLWVPVYGTVLAVDIEDPVINTTNYDEEGALKGEWETMPQKLDLTNMVKDAQSKKYILETYILPGRKARLRYTFRLNNGKYKQRELDETMLNVLFL